MTSAGTPLDSEDIDGIARNLLREARVDHAPPLVIAHRLGLQLSTSVASGCRGQTAGNIVRISRRRGESAMAWQLSHELAHVACDLCGIDRPHHERSVDAIAAAIVAPRREVRRAIHSHGIDLARVANDLGVTQTIAALRFGEVFDEPLAVMISSARIARRGPPTLPPDDTVRRIVTEGGAPGCRVVVITDAPGRFVLLAA